MNNLVDVTKDGKIIISERTSIEFDKCGPTSPIVLSCTTTGVREGVPFVNIVSSKNNFENTEAGDLLNGISFKGYHDGKFKISSIIATRWAADAELKEEKPKSDIFITTNNHNSNYNHFVFKNDGAFSAAILQASTSDLTTGKTITFSNEQERDNFISNPASGMITFITRDSYGTARFQGYNGKEWVNLNQ
jgi:hypothetical protein